MTTLIDREAVLAQFDAIWRQTAVDHFAARQDTHDPGRRDYLLGLGVGMERAIAIVRAAETKEVIS